MTIDPTGLADYVARLDALAPGADITLVLQLYDTLPPASIDDMIGEWRGSGLPTGHPFDGLLERFGWFGKRFRGPEDVDPLLFSNSDGTLFALNPTLMPMGLIDAHPRIAHNEAAGMLFKLGGKLLATDKPQARLRMTEFRGVVTATMIYDRVPINDVFRKVTENIRLGAMDMRGSNDPFMFVLRRG
jgi:hypothetical protein